MTKRKFRMWQVVRINYSDVRLYGIVIGFDNGRWHVMVGHSTHKCLPGILRKLTKLEAAR